MPGAVPVGRHAFLDQLRATGDEDAARCIVRTQGLRGPEALESGVEAAFVIGGMTLAPSIEECLVRCRAVGETERLVDLHHLGRTDGDDPIDRTPHEPVRGAGGDLAVRAIWGIAPVRLAAPTGGIALILSWLAVALAGLWPRRGAEG